MDDIRVLNAFGVVYDKLGRFDLSARYYDEAMEDLFLMSILTDAKGGMIGHARRFRLQLSQSGRSGIGDSRSLLQAHLNVLDAGHPRR